VQTWVSSGKTLYIGDKSSNRRIAIYDNRAQLIALNGTLPAAFKVEVPPEDVTRIEFRLKKLPLQLIALNKLSSPFEKLQIAAYGANALVYADWLKEHSASLKKAGGLGGEPVESHSLVGVVPPRPSPR
jgi:hypothetical protein